MFSEQAQVILPLFFRKVATRFSAPKLYMFCVPASQVQHGRHVIEGEKIAMANPERAELPLRSRDREHKPPCKLVSGTPRVFWLQWRLLAHTFFSL